MGIGNKLSAGLEKYSIEAGRQMQKNFKVMEDNQILIQKNQVEFEKYLKDIKRSQKLIENRLEILTIDIGILLNKLKHIKELKN